MGSRVDPTTEFPFQSVPYPLDKYVSDGYRKNYVVRVKNADVAEGAEAIKHKRDAYLVPTCSSKKVFDEALDRSVFVPFTKQYLNSIIGSLSRSKLRINNSSGVELSDIHYDPLLPFNIIKEVMITGLKCFVVEPTRDGKAYVAQYTAENVLRYDLDSDGNIVYLLLRDIIPADNRPAGEGREKQINYLQYELTPNGLVVYRLDSAFDVLAKVTPVIRGIPYNFIPAVIIGSDNEYPVVTDMAELNIQHYNLYSLLMLATRYSSFPIYTAPVTRQSQTEVVYKVSPNTVWEYDANAGSGPTVLEYFGRGRADTIEMLKNIEAAIANTGARITGLRAAGLQYESPGIFHLLRSIEASDIVLILKEVERGLGKLFDLYKKIADSIPDTEVETEVFISKWGLLSSPLDPIGLNSLSRLLKEGQISPKVMYENLANSGYIDPDMTFEEFDAMVKQHQEEMDQREVELEKEKEQAKAEVQKENKPEPSPNQLNPNQFQQFQPNDMRE